MTKEKKIPDIPKPYYGWTCSEEDKRDFRFSAILPGQVHLPKKVDLRKKMPKVVAQGYIGSCTACASAALAEYILRKDYPKRAFRPSILAQYYWTRLLEGTERWDVGAQMRTSLKALNKFGAAYTKLWPYRPKRFSIRPSKKTHKNAKKHRVVEYRRLDQTLEELKSCLASGFPFIFGFWVYESFESLETHVTGIMPTPDPSTERFYGGHAVTCVGYSDEKEAFLIRNSWGCYDPETEVLTKGGWKKIAKVKLGENVATLNPETHQLEYQQVKALHKYPYSGNLWHYKGRDVDLLVTPNHKMYVAAKANRKDSKKWNLLEAQNIPWQNFCMKKDAHWIGTEKEFHVVGDKKVPMDLWLQFLGLFISEGHTTTHTFIRKARMKKCRLYNRGLKNVPRNRHTGRYEATNRRRQYDRTVMRHVKAQQQTSYTVGISQQKSHNIEKIQTILDALPWAFTRNNTTWTTNNKALFDELQRLKNAPKKFIPKYIWRLSSRQQKILFDHLMLGDGTYSSGKCVYYTSSKRLANEVQRLALHIGLAADIGISDRRGQISTSGIKRQKLEYQVGIKRVCLQPCVPQWRDPDKVHHEGFVYCLTVPNHILYVRRNGKAVWSGNSSWALNGHFWMPYSLALDPSLSEDFWTARMITMPPKPKPRPKRRRRKRKRRRPFIRTRRRKRRERRLQV